MAKSPTTELSAYLIPNLIQGVSQQSAQERRDTQCENQSNAINSAVNGNEARPGMDYLGKISGVDLTGALTYEIQRGDGEHYLVVIAKTAYGSGTPRKLHVYDLNTGAECTTTFTAAETYLATVGDPRDSLVCSTLNDITFIGNKEIKPAMSTSLKSAAAKNSAVLFFKAGGYSITYQIAVRISGTTYRWTYVTPDNSTTANAEYISTNNIAAAFFRSFTGVNPTYAGGGSVNGVGGSGDGVVTGVPGATMTNVSSTTLTALGFTVKINANLIEISRSDSTAFSIDTGDGVGDTYLRCIKGTAQAFADLPKSCFSGFTCKVIGTNKQSEDDYWVQYVGDDGSSGSWQEVVAPATSLTFDAATMPIELFNSDVGEFELRTPTWGNRVSGDGINSAKDPSFVGKYIQDLFYDHGRLGILTEGSAVWARSRNPYVFFPDTAQTVLDTDPIDYDVGAGKRIALLRRMVQVGEGSFLWAERLQFRVHSGNNTFRQDTVEAPLSTSYEFAPAAVPVPVGDSLYFASEPGDYAMVRDLSVRDGKPLGATDVTQHVPRLIPQGVRGLTASDTLNEVAAWTDGADATLYFYNYLISVDKRLQSAWNTWTLPANSKVLWASLALNKMHLLVQRPDDDEALLLTMDLTVNAVDPVDGATYLTRLDFKVTEADVSMSYDADTKETTITMPYGMSDAAGYEFVDTSSYPPMFVVNRTGDNDVVRGREWLIKSITSSTIVVSGDCTAQDLYIGYRITAEYELSRFYLKSPQGLVPTSSLVVKDFVVSYAHTGYFRAVVTYKDSDVVDTHEMTGRILGSADNLLGVHPIIEGQFRVPIDADNDKYTLKLINDSFLPSRWTSGAYNFQAAFLAKPSSYGQGSASA